MNYFGNDKTREFIGIVRGQLERKYSDSPDGIRTYNFASNLERSRDDFRVLPAEFQEQLEPFYLCQGLTETQIAELIKQEKLAQQIQQQGEVIKAGLKSGVINPREAEERLEELIKLFDPNVVEKS